jgi:predicted kinase
MQIVVLPIGSSGSDKSTWIQKINADNRFVVISADMIRLELTGSIDDKSHDDKIYMLVKRRAVIELKFGKCVIVDATNLQTARRIDFLDYLERFAGVNYEVKYKLLPVEPSDAKARIAKQLANSEHRANVPDDTIDRHAELYKIALEDIKFEQMTPYEELQY